MQAHGDPADPARQIRDTVSEQLFKAAATVLGTACWYLWEHCYLWSLSFIP